MKNSGNLILTAGLLLFIFMLSSLLLMSNALQDSSYFGRFYLALLVLNILGILCLVVLIALNLRRLIRQLRRRIPGTRMTVRMVVMFTILSVTPVLVVYYFSLDFLNRGIDNWFDLRVEQALDDSLELSRLSLDTRIRELLRKTEQMAGELSNIPDAAMPFEIDDLRFNNGARELTLMTRQGQIITSSSDSPARLVPDRPDETILLQLQQGSSYTGLDTIGEEGLHIRVVVNVPGGDLKRGEKIVQALFPISERMNDLAESVQASFVKYNELSYLREQLKISFVIILTLVLLFSVFSAVWAAFYSARRLTEPVTNLARGTSAVAAGDYAMRLPVPGNDELGFLVASFNDMTRKIALSQEQAARSQFEAETQHSYLEAVLGRLSSGVLVLDQDFRLRTANNSAGQILGLPLANLENRTLEEIAAVYPDFSQFREAIAAHLSPGEKEWREQITLGGSGSRVTLMCSGTTLPGTHGMQHGFVIVIDNITDLIQAQRYAALSDLARRLAHEIKNPLTPIQLATERLRHKYLRGMKANDTDTFDRLTNTIIQQVETMKDMVNSFSDFSRTPEINLQPLNLNVLIMETLDLHANLNRNARIITDLEEGLPQALVDESRMRQVLNNLLRNAFEACEQSPAFTLEVSTRSIAEASGNFIDIRIKDSGTGVAEDIMDSMFDPYTTTKTRGTGLGLAIVKKIVEEHKGRVWLENNPSGTGACAIVRLPGLAVPARSETTHRNHRGVA